MTSETPCLPNCFGAYVPSRDNHLPACPNAPKPAEPPACGCFGPCGNPDCCERCAEPQSEPLIDAEPWVKIADWHIKERPQHAMTGLCRAFNSLKAERDILKLALAEESGYLKRASAERDALKAEVENVRQYARIEITDLRAVRGGLEMRLQTELAKNAALKARVEELSENLLWATSSYEERVVILARREKRKEQDASNGK